LGIQFRSAKTSGGLDDRPLSRKMSESSSFLNTDVAEFATPAKFKYWRLIPLLDAPGQTQMAIDRWLLNQHRQGLHPPTLRFYTWSPPAISLGYHQRHYPTGWQQLSWNHQPIALVRRPSGGRAVLHQGDLTYAMIASGLPKNRMQAYQEICEFLIAGWRSLGVELNYGEAGRGYIHNPNCFGTATAADLVLPTGAKLIGSAQLRQGDTILQHGSIRLNPDPALFQQVFGIALEPIALPFPTDTASQTVIEALSTALSDRLEVPLVSQPLTPTEWQAIESATN
jgi:lipoate---protein ligase